MGTLYKSKEPQASLVPLPSCSVKTKDSKVQKPQDNYRSPEREKRFRKHPLFHAPCQMRWQSAPPPLPSWAPLSHHCGDVAGRCHAARIQYQHWWTSSPTWAADQMLLQSRLVVLNTLKSGWWRYRWVLSAHDWTLIQKFAAFHWLDYDNQLLVE